MLVGPFAGALAVTVVLVVQALLFADGGLSALGLNVVNMALVGAFAGYGVFVVARRLLGRTAPSVATAAGIAAFTGTGAGRRRRSRSSTRSAATTRCPSAPSPAR